MDRCCANCVHWKRADWLGKVQDYGECRRLSPVLSVHYDALASFPKTQSDGWCGEFSPRTQPPQAAIFGG